LTCIHCHPCLARLFQPCAEEQKQANAEVVAANERLIASKLKLENKVERLKTAVAASGPASDDVAKVCFLPYPYQCLMIVASA